MELMAGGIFHYRNKRAIHIGIGALIVVLAAVVIAFRVFSGFVVIGFVSFALVFSGISSTIDGIVNKKMPGWARAVSIATGALTILVGGLALFSPVIGTLVVALILALGMAVYGMHLIASGIAGQRRTMTPAAAQTSASTAA
jgi:uncharacterized membrane protein HdeD (DUF308 family)